MISVDPKKNKGVIKDSLWAIGPKFISSLVYRGLWCTLPFSDNPETALQSALPHRGAPGTTFQAAGLRPLLPSCSYAGRIPDNDKPSPAISGLHSDQSNGENLESSCARELASMTELPSAWGGGAHFQFPRKTAFPRAERWSWAELRRGRDTHASSSGRLSLGKCRAGDFREPKALAWGCTSTGFKPESLNQ